MLAAQLVNFLVVAFVIWRFLLRARHGDHEEPTGEDCAGLADADAGAHVACGGVCGEGEGPPAGFRGRYRLLENARDEAERLRAASLERAGRDADRLIAEARAVMELERRDMERAIRGLSLELSGRILESAMEGCSAMTKRRASLRAGCSASRRRAAGEAASSTSLWTRTVRSATIRLRGCWKAFRVPI